VNGMGNKGLLAVSTVVAVAALGIGVGSMTLPAAGPLPAKAMPVPAARAEKPPEAPKPPASKADPVTVKGRVIDLQGKPVRGAVITVESVGTGPDGTLDGFFEGWRRFPDQALHAIAEKPSPAGAPVRPQPLKIDAEGRFEVPDVPGDHLLALRFEADGFEHEVLRIVTRSGFDPKPFADDARTVPKLFGPDF